MIIRGVRTKGLPGFQFHTTCIVFLACGYLIGFFILVALINRVVSFILLRHFPASAVLRNGACVAVYSVVLSVHSPG